MRARAWLRAPGSGLLLLSLLAACSGGQPRGPMSDGERLYRAKCTSCHKVYEPREQTPEQWVRTVDKMEALRKVTLDPGERALILQYLTGVAGAGAPGHLP